jgi:hypothetical protein
MHAFLKWEGSMDGQNVCLWRLADMAIVLSDACFEG